MNKIIKKCSVKGCNGKYNCKNYCKKHYNQIRTKGYIFISKRGLSAYERFISLTLNNPNNNCIEWIGAKQLKGYGRFNPNGKAMGAHRFSYEHYIGSIPFGMHILHRCDNPSCVNHEHLFLGTNLENVRDMMSKKRNRHKKGEDCTHSKLKNIQVIEIKNLLSKGFGANEISKNLNIKRHYIESIKHNRAWNHINLEQNI
jgi:hypothetical protein